MEDQQIVSESSDPSPPESGPRKPSSGTVKFAADVSGGGYRKLPTSDTTPTPTEGSSPEHPPAGTHHENAEATSCWLRGRWRRWVFDKDNVHQRTAVLGVVFIVCVLVGVAMQCVYIGYVELGHHKDSWMRYSWVVSINVWVLGCLILAFLIWDNRDFRRCQRTNVYNYGDDQTRSASASSPVSGSSTGPSDEGKAKETGKGTGSPTTTSSSDPDELVPIAPSTSVEPRPDAPKEPDEPKPSTSTQPIEPQVRVVDTPL